MYSTLEHLVASFFLKVSSTNATEKIESAGKKKK